MNNEEKVRKNDDHVEYFVVEGGLYKAVRFSRQ